MHADAPIHLARAADAGAIARLSRDAIEHGLEWSWTPARVMRSLRDHATNVVVARHGPALQGFGIMKYGDEDAHLMLLAVVPARRRAGVGSALLAWLDATARAAGMGNIQLEMRRSNGEARAFYAHHGYADCGLLPAYYQGVEDAVRMRKRLAAAA
jgi:ribosomal-protein-alanine N-acetyltransferase